MPQPVPELSFEIAGAVQAEHDYGCAWDREGAVRCASLKRKGIVVVEPPLPAVSAVVAGRFHYCALLRSGRVACFGSNSTGQLGPAAAGGEVSGRGQCPTSGGNTSDCSEADGDYVPVIVPEARSG